MKRIAKAIFSVFEKFLNHHGYVITWSPMILLDDSYLLSFDLEYVIAHFMLRKTDIFFIQIGANDGVSNDPLYKFVSEYGWNGVLLEPLPEVFEVLKFNYKDSPNLRFVNAAISEQDGTRKLYTVHMDDSTFSKARQFSSFRRESLLQRTDMVSDIASRIEEIQVRCISFATLVNEIGNRVVDILLMDTEGYDFAILKMINFSDIKPSIICYEHIYMSKAEQRAAAELLTRQGYRLTKDNLDTVAYYPITTYGFR
jgi:FkbM family methyltransferase